MRDAPEKNKFMLNAKKQILAQTSVRWWDLNGSNLSWTKQLGVCGEPGFVCLGFLLRSDLSPTLRLAAVTGSVLRYSPCVFSSPGMLSALH